MKDLSLIILVQIVSAILARLHAADILIINGSGSSSIAGPLAAAGFGVIQDSFHPGVIASHLASDNNISEIWIWNDGTFGNSFSPADPSKAFNIADQAALTTFNTLHHNWIMDALSWRGNSSVSEQNFTKNEGLNLAHAGGGVVLGADDASGDAIVQHVNQVSGWFNFNLWSGVYRTSAASQQVEGTLLTSPNLMDPSQIFGTTTYADVPNGIQPNGLFLGTALFGEGIPLQGYTLSPVPDLSDAAFKGVTYPNVDHLVTTTIPGASIECFSVPDRNFCLALLAPVSIGLIRVNQFLTNRTRQGKV